MGEWYEFLSIPTHVNASGSFADLGVQTFRSFG